MSLLTNNYIAALEVNCIMSLNRLVITINNVKYNNNKNIVRYIKINVPGVCTYFGGSTSMG